MNKKYWIRFNKVTNLTETRMTVYGKKPAGQGWKEVKIADCECGTLDCGGGGNVASTDFPVDSTLARTFNVGLLNLSSGVIAPLSVTSPVNTDSVVGGTVTVSAKRPYAIITVRFPYNPVGLPFEQSYFPMYNVHSYGILEVTSDPVTNDFLVKMVVTPIDGQQLTFVPTVWCTNLIGGLKAVMGIADTAFLSNEPTVSGWLGAGNNNTFLVPYSATSDYWIELLGTPITNWKVQLSYHGSIVWESAPISSATKFYKFNAPTTLAGIDGFNILLV